MFSWRSVLGIAALWLVVGSQPASTGEQSGRLVGRVLVTAAGVDRSPNAVWRRRWW